MGLELHLLAVAVLEVDSAPPVQAVHPLGRRSVHGQWAERALADSWLATWLFSSLAATPVCWVLAPHNPRPHDPQLVHRPPHHHLGAACLLSVRVETSYVLTSSCTRANGSTDSMASMVMQIPNFSMTHDIGQQVAIQLQCNGFTMPQAWFHACAAELQTVRTAQHTHTSPLPTPPLRSRPNHNMMPCRSPQPAPLWAST